MPNPLAVDIKTVLETDQWAGKRCFVIGGGPSCKGLNWDLLKDELVVGTNKAFTLGPEVCDIVCAMDRRFWNWHNTDQRLIDHPLKVWPDGSSGWQQEWPVYRLSSKGMFFWGQNLDEGVGAGPDTGFRAVNLADILGASPIYLLGFDHKGGDDGKQAWWHDGYGKCRQKNHVYARYRKALTAAHDSGRIRGEIINLSPESSLECYPKQTIESVLGPTALS